MIFLWYSWCKDLVLSLGDSFLKLGQGRQVSTTTLIEPTDEGSNVVCIQLLNHMTRKKEKKPLRLGLVKESVVPYKVQKLQESGNPLYVRESINIASSFDAKADVVLYHGDCLDLLSALPDQLARLVVTSPPYNIGKPYERKLHLTDYLEQQRKVIRESVRVLSDNGSICWQVGNYQVGNSTVGYCTVPNLQGTRPETSKQDNLAF